MVGWAALASRLIEMMPTFWLTYITRSFVRSGQRALFAVVCVIVGVAGVVALQTAGLMVDHALVSNVRAANGGDISMTSDEVPLSRVDLQVFESLRREGRIAAWTAVASVHATTVGSRGRLVPFSIELVSVPPYPLGGRQPLVSPQNGTVSGLLARPGDVLVTTVLAQELGVNPGSRLRVASVGGSGFHATVRGILAGTSLDHSAAMTASIRDMAAISTAPPRYTAVYANVRGSPDSVAHLLGNRFPTATVQTVSQALQIAHQEVHDFQQFLLLVALLALLIAGVGILNAMQSILARRRLEIAMLKAIGYREPALYLLFGGEAALIGAIGGVAGTALGAAGSKIIGEALARAAAIQVTFVLDGTTILAGVFLGVFATLLFSVIPIVRAAALRPVEVLREGAPTPSAQWVRIALLLVLVFILFTALTVVAVGDAVLAAQFVVSVGVTCAILATLFSLAVAWIGRLGPAGSRIRSVPILLGFLILAVAAALRVPAIAAIVALGALLFGLTVLLPARTLLPLLIAARSLSRRRARTSMILVAFLAGVLTMTVTLTVALGLQRQVAAALASRQSQSLVAVAAGERSDRILRASRALTGIHGHNVMTTISTEPVSVNGRPLSSYTGSGQGGEGDTGEEGIWALDGLTGLSLSHGALPRDIQVVEGRNLSAADAGTNHVLVRNDLAGYPYFLGPGGAITLRETGSGIVRTARVVGLYRQTREEDRFNAVSTPPIYGDEQLAVLLGGADVQTVVSFAADQHVLAHDAATLQRVLPDVLVIDVGDLTAVVDTILSELLHLLTVVTALVLGAGVAVVANGVALAMLEQRREIALFKAIGFGTRSVQSFVLIENALVGALAGAASVLVSAIALSLLSRFALDQAVGFDSGLAVLVLLLTVALAMVTAYLSARRPIEVRPLEALRND